MKLKKLFIIFLCFMMVLSCACTIEPSDEITTRDEAEESTLPSAVSLAGYKVIRPTEAGQKIVESAVALRNELNSYFGNGVGIGDDWVQNGAELPAQALEILIGNTTRAESAEVKSGLLGDDFAVKYFPESGRIAICGGSDEATARAVEHFIEFCIKKTDGGAEIAYGLSFFSAGEYAVKECRLQGYPITDYTLVIPDKADLDEKYASQLIKNKIMEKTGAILNIIKESESEKGKRILIGRTASAPAEFTSLSGSAAGYVLGADGDAIVICGDGGMVVQAARKLVSELFPKGADKVSLELPAASVTMIKKTEYPTLTDFGTKPIALADQLNASIAVYDLASGEAVLKYEFKPKTARGFSLVGYGNRVDEARLRYSEKWDSYIIMFTSSSGYVGIAGYPSEKCLWEVELKGTSPHSIEYLPNGTVAVASSGGNNTENGFIRLYSTDKNGNTYKYAEARLTSAHAVLWDESRGVLWAMGSTDIVAYEIGDDPSNPKLERISGYGSSEMKGGHDLSAICGDDDKVWVGGSFIRTFDRSTGVLSSKYDGESVISMGSVKCICSFPDGSAARTVATGVYADHNTDRFRLYTFENGGVTEKVYEFSTRAFYKARSFIASYN